ncbi:MAG: hypothetical protein JO257_02575 [Deltaproteobacteria bacterium]|nr:hypothetical protein [Deltaproteobacteria bacterium]
MRKLALVLLIAACGKSPSTTGGPDADMMGSNTGSNTGGGSLAFEVKSTDIPLPHNTEFTKCYYFHTSNTAPVAINEWVSDMTPGSHHLIMFLNLSGASQPADGTIDENCSFGNSATNIPSWTYAAAIPHADEVFPADDGAGKPLAQVIQPNTAGFIQMHYLNATDNDETVHVDVKAYKLADGAAYTGTAPYITYTKNFSVPVGGTTITGSCPAPAGTKFWQLSSHTHKQGLEVKITDGATMAYSSTDNNGNWEHPNVKNFGSSPFFTFSSNQVSWSCQYENTGTTAIQEGQSAQTNEMCMATGYYFPATAAKLDVEFYQSPTQHSCFAVN